MSERSRHNTGPCPTLVVATGAVLVVVHIVQVMRKRGLSALSDGDVAQPRDAGTEWVRRVEGSGAGANRDRHDRRVRGGPRGPGGRACL